MADNAPRATLRLALWGSLLGYVALSWRAVATDQALYADGAYFAFLATLQEPWTLGLSEFPARIGALALTVGPAYLSQAFGLTSPHDTRVVYQAVLFAVPVVAFSLAWVGLPTCSSSVQLESRISRE